MSENIEIENVNGVDEVHFIPRGVCSKLFNIKIKDNKILEMEAVGGCNGNLKGIGSLLKGMDVNEAIQRLQGIPCGSRMTSCPDQISQGLKLYVAQKSGVAV